MAGVSDEELRTLIRSDPRRAWRTFIDQYTPMMLGLIRRAGVDDRDEMMDVYVLVCERLSERGFQRLRTQDAARGSIGGWLAVIIRHAAVDWIRSKKGRRRLFQAVKDLAPFDQRVFELFYWDERAPAEIAELLSIETKRRAVVGDVLEALARIDARLTDRHRSELISLAIRSKEPLAIDDSSAASLPASGLDPEGVARSREIHEHFEAALRLLPAEDAAIVRMKFVEGLATSDVEFALGTKIPMRRIDEIIARLRAVLRERGVDERDAPLAEGITLA